jgi:hypothetical protein
MESLVAGQHRHVIAVNPAKDADGHGAMGRNWLSAQGILVDELSDEDIDLEILQRPKAHFALDRFRAQRDGVIDECCE